MSKPIKDWGVVKFLTKKLPNKAGDILSEAANVATGQKTIFQAIGGVISDPEVELSPEDIAKVYELAQLDIEKQQLHNEEMANVRNMQIENLKHGDAFTRRFVYWYAASMTALVFVVLIMLFFVEIPEDNKQTINMIIGVIIGTGLSGVFQYFFGSSQGSKNKEGAINTILSKFTQS